jgi:hypothetical protein
MNADEHRLMEAAMHALSERIIGCAFQVSNSRRRRTAHTPLPLCPLLNFGKPRVEIKRDRRESVFICVYLWPNPLESANPQQTP